MIKLLLEKRYEVAVAICSATIVSLGRVHLQDSADSLVPVFVSLWRWTPFYWEQDRFGMLVPLMAFPLRDPFWNLVFQSWLTAFAGTAGILLTAVWLSRDRQMAGVIGMAALSSLLVLTSFDYQCFFWSTGQPYAVAVPLAVLAALILRWGKSSSKRGLALLSATGLMLLCAWVNSSMCLLFIPLGAAVWIAQSGSRANIGGRRWYFALAGDPAIQVSMLAMIGVGASLVWQRLSAFRTTWLVLPSVDEWGSLLNQFSADLIDYIGLWTWGATTLAATALVTVYALVKSARRERPREQLLPLLIIGATVAYGIFMALLFKGRARYFTGAFVFIHVVATSWVVHAVFGDVPERTIQVLRRALAVLTLGICVFSYGWPSVSALRSTLTTKFGTASDDIIKGKVSHIIGDYWKVWPAAFLANVTLYERGENRTVWAVTFRSRPTESLWSEYPQSGWILASTPDDLEAQRYATLYGLGTLQLVKETPRVVFYSLAATAGPRAATISH